MRKVITPLIVLLTLVALAPPAAAATSTTVSPAGDHVSLSLPASKPMTITGGAASGSCTTATSSPGGTAAMNKIPLVNNPNPTGPVTVKLNPPAISGCTTSLSGFTAAVNTSGVWKLSLQDRPGLPTDRAIIIIPQAGLQIVLTGPITCSATIAANGPIRVGGTWADGTPSRVRLVSAPVDITYDPGPPGCPTGTASGSIDATFQVRNTDNPTQHVTVSA
jgi:hypothetical protein